MLNAEQSPQGELGNIEGILSAIGKGIEGMNGNRDTEKMDQYRTQVQGVIAELLHLQDVDVLVVDDLLRRTGADKVYPMPAPNNNNKSYDFEGYGYA